MLTTASWSGNSNRCGTRASRSFGPMSGSVLMIVNTLSITSRNSDDELNSAIARAGRRVQCRADLVHGRLLGVAHALPAHPENAFPVRARDVFGEVLDELLVFGQLFGRPLLLNQPHCFPQAPEQVALHLLERAVACVVDVGLHGDDLVEQLAVAVRLACLRIGLGDREALAEAAAALPKRHDESRARRSIQDLLPLLRREVGLSGHADAPSASLGG